MLSRSTQIGEYYIMSPPRFSFKAGTAHACDLTIYDEEKDDFVTITWADAAVATGCFNVNELGTDLPKVKGTLYDEKGSLNLNAGVGNTTALGTWTEQVKEWNTFCTNASTGGSPPTSRPCIVLARPFIEHLVRAPMRTFLPTPRVPHRRFRPVLTSTDAFGDPDGVWT